MQVRINKEEVPMRFMPEKYYHEDDMNRHCFFQPASSSKILEETLKTEKQIDSFPNPLDRYRAPTPRLIPRGYK